MSEQQAQGDVNSGELLNLKTLAENRTGFARGALFDRVAGLLFEGKGELTPEVSALIDQILTGLIKHVEADVRQKVAHRLSSLKTAPHELTKMLANDAIEIARPILTSFAGSDRHRPDRRGGDPRRRTIAWRSPCGRRCLPM